MRAITLGNAIGSGPHKSFEITSHNLPQVLDIEIQGLTFVLMAFGLALVQFLPISLVLSIGMGIFVLCLCISAMLNFLLHFHRGSQLRVGFVSQRRLWTWICTVKILVTLRHGWNAFCIKRCTWVFWWTEVEYQFIFRCPQKASCVHWWVFQRWPDYEGIKTDLLLESGAWQEEMVHQVCDLKRYIYLLYFFPHSLLLTIPWAVLFHHPCLPHHPFLEMSNYGLKSL